MILHKLLRKTFGMAMKNFIFIYCISICIENPKCMVKAMPSEIRDYDSSNEPNYQPEFFNGPITGNSNIKMSILVII